MKFILKNSIKNYYISGERDKHRHHMYTKRFDMHDKRFGVGKNWGTTGSCFIIEHARN